MNLKKLAKWKKRKGLLSVYLLDFLRFRREYLDFPSFA